MMNRLLASSIVIGCCFTTVAHAAGGSPAPTRPQPQVEFSPEEQADQRYNRGLKIRDRAWKFEKQAGEVDNDKKREKLLDRAQREYTSAIRQFRAAVQLKNDHFKALSSLGYALRKVGEYESSLAAYDRALDIEPEYTEAIEYRGQAYMMLGRLDEAKEAYLYLFREDREKADLLFAAMRSWAAENEVDDAFTAWLDEREKLATQVSMGRSTHAGSW